jgi:hypothetical protein
MEYANFYEYQKDVTDDISFECNFLYKEGKWEIVTKEDINKTKKSFVVYGESGQHCTHGDEKEVKSVGTPRALARIRNYYADRWGHHTGYKWVDARIFIFAGTLAEFRARYSEISEPHYITECTYRPQVFERY